MTNQTDSTAPAQSITNSNDEVTHRRPMIKDIPCYPNPNYRPPPKPTRPPTPGSSQSPEIYIDLEENSPISRWCTFRDIPKVRQVIFQEPQELEGLINTHNLVQKCLPKQDDIDKILMVIQRKVLKGTHLPVMIKEIRAGYLISPYFKDIFSYLAQNKLPSTKSTTQKVNTLPKNIYYWDSLLFKIITTPEKETALLAIPEICTDKIIIIYHSSLFAGHKGVIQTYLTINDKFLIPYLINYLRYYIKGCYICQLALNGKTLTRQLQTRINPNYIPLSRLSIDFKVMPRSYRGHRYILCIIDEVTNYLITIPIHQA